MSIIDSYRRSALRKREEIARLQQEKAREAKKIADAGKRTNSANQTMLRSKSFSTLKSKMSEIEREQKKIASAENKIANIEKKIANNQKDLNRSMEKISREEQKELKSKEVLAQKHESENKKQMNEIAQTLDQHSELHEETIARLNEIQNLPEKITVLFLASNPLDQSQLRLDEEARAINEKIRSSKHRDSVNLVSCWAVRPLDILQALNEHSPAIVHFSGHGSVQGELVFQGGNGETKLVSKEAIVETITASSDGIRLVFFNACHSQLQAESIVNHVEAAIGMNSAIGDSAARVFSAMFYSAIGFGLSVKKAFLQAKAALMLENIPEENIPELFIKAGLSSDEIFIVKPSSDEKI